MLSSRLRRATLVLVLLSIPSLFRAGLAPRLVRDIDETSYAVSSSPRQFGGVELGVTFTAFGGRELETLWLSSAETEAIAAPPPHLLTAPPGEPSHSTSETPAVSETPKGSETPPAPGPGAPPRSGERRRAEHP